MAFPETRAALLRLSAAIRGRHPCHVADALRQYLGPCLTWEHKWRSEPYFRPRRDGGGHVILPAELHEQEEALITLEEIGHFLCRAGLTPPTVNPRRDRHGLISLAELREWDEEHEARRFVESLLLPIQEVLKLRHDWDAYELLEGTGLPPDTLQRRIQDVSRLRALLGGEPEQWSAWGRFRTHFHKHRWLSHLRVSSRDRRWSCAWPVIPHQRGAAELQLHLDLAALRPVEFMLKYQDEENVPAEDVEWHWQEFLDGPAAELVNLKGADRDEWL